MSYPNFSMVVLYMMFHLLGPPLHEALDSSKHFQPLCFAFSLKHFELWQNNTVSSFHSFHEWLGSICFTSCAYHALQHNVPMVYLELSWGTSRSAFSSWSVVCICNLQRWLPFVQLHVMICCCCLPLQGHPLYHFSDWHRAGSLLPVLVLPVRFCRVLEPYFCLIYNFHSSVYLFRPQFFLGFACKKRRERSTQKWLWISPMKWW